MYGVAQRACVGAAEAVQRPLDSVASIYATMGVVRLLKTHRGPIVKIRRAYDEVEQDFYPEQFSGRLNANLIRTWLGGRTGYFSELYDQTGNSHKAVCTTTAAQSKLGQMQPVVDLTSSFPTMFFGSGTAPGQGMILSTSQGFARNSGGITLAVTWRSIVNSSAGNRVVVAVSKNDSATRAQISSGFPAATWSAGGRRQNGDSFTPLAGPNYDTDWHIHVARLDYANADIFYDVDATAGSNTSWLTAGTTPDADAFWEVNIGMNSGRSAGFVSGQVSAIVLMSSVATPSADLVTALAPTKATGGHSHTLTSLFTVSSPVGGQGFCGDQTNFWIGHSIGDGGAGTINKVTYAGAAVADWSAIVDHAQSVFLRPDNDTLMVSNYDSTGATAPKLQEMSKTDGTAIRDWQFTGVGYAKAPTMCYYGTDQILLATHPDMDFEGAPHVSLVQINDNETFSVLNSWRFTNCLGQLQGMVYKDSYLYVIIDDDTVNADRANGTIYKLQLVGGANDDSGAGSVTIVASFPQMRAKGGEQEGLTWDGAAWYQITNADGTTVRVNAITGLT